jgi:hypothetical protein
VKLKELLNLSPGDLVLGINSVIAPQTTYLTINETGWDDAVEQLPPVFFIRHDFIEKCDRLKYTTPTNMDNTHLLNNYLSVSGRAIRGSFDYLAVPDICPGDMLGMSLGETICMYEHAPSAEMYRPLSKLITLKLYHKMLHKDMILWLQLNLEAFITTENPLNNNLNSVIMEIDVRIK